MMKNNQQDDSRAKKPNAGSQNTKVLINQTKLKRRNREKQRKNCKQVSRIKVN